MKTALIILTLAELALLVAVLAAYLLVIASTLRTVSRTLGLVTFGVRAIEKQTDDFGPVITDVNTALQRVTALLGVPPTRPRVSERTVPAVEHSGGPETSTAG
jgi:uncharacterized protein YoxC